jgi:hypothetical protein
MENLGKMIETSYWILMEWDWKSMVNYELESRWKTLFAPGYSEDL